MTRPFSDELISAYLDGELDADERVRVEQAMTADADLRRMYDELRALRCALQSLPRCELEDDLVDRAMLRTESLTPTGSDRRSGSQHTGPVVRRTQPLFRRWRTMLGAAASLAAVLVLSVLLLPGPNATRVASTDSAAEVDSKSADEVDQPANEWMMKSAGEPPMARSEGAAVWPADAADDLETIEGELTLSKKAKSPAADADAVMQKKTERGFSRGRLVREQAEPSNLATVDKVMQRLEKDRQVFIQVGFSGQAAKESRKSTIEWFAKDRNSRLVAPEVELLPGELALRQKHDHPTAKRRAGVPIAGPSRSDHDIVVVEGSAEQVKATLVNLQQRSGVALSFADPSGVDSSRPPSSGDRRRGFGDPRGGAAVMGLGGGMMGGGMMGGSGGMMGSGAGMAAQNATAPESAIAGDQAAGLGGANGQSKPSIETPDKPPEMHSQHPLIDGKSNTAQSLAPGQADLDQKPDQGVVWLLLRLQPLAEGPDVLD